MCFWILCRFYYELHFSLWIVVLPKKKSFSKFGQFPKKPWSNFQFAVFASIFPWHVIPIFRGCPAVGIDYFQIPEQWNGCLLFYTNATLSRLIGHAKGEYIIDMEERQVVNKGIVKDIINDENSRKGQSTFL